MPVKSVRRKRAVRANTGTIGGRKFDPTEYQAAKDRKRFDEIERESQEVDVVGIVSRLRAAIESRPNFDLEYADGPQPEAEVARRGGQRLWTTTEDDGVRAAWHTSWPQEFVWETLAKWQGRTVAALKSRAYAIGLRRWTPEQRRAYHTRAAERRAAIDECLMTGGQRKTLAKALGINPCSIAIRHGDLAFEGIDMPLVPWWVDGIVQRAAPVWKTVANAAWAEYRDNGPRPLGDRCMCKHYESQHVSGICTTVNKRGQVCECPQFVVHGEKREHRNEQILRLCVGLDDRIRMRETREDTAITFLEMHAAAPPTDDTEIAECFRDDHDRYVQMGYVSWRLHRAI